MKSKVINLFGDKDISQNKDVKYSELLTEFIAPFDSDFADTEYYEDVIDIAIAAWNFGNMKMLLPEDEGNDAINSIVEEDVNLDLLNRMIELKITKFKEFSDFIIDYELGEREGDPLLSVITQEKELYLTAMVQDMEADHTESDFEENYIHRQAVILKPLQPFLDWFTSLYPDDSENMNESMTYLMSLEIDDVEAWLKKNYDKLFIRELEGWHTNKKEWPQKRTYKMFKQWFQADISTMVYDLEKEPIFKG